jgi:hypothetical protein
MNLAPINAKRERNNQPLRTSLEFCAEFGITMAELRGRLAAHDAPKARLQHRGKAYFEPKEMRKWWKKSLALKEEIN